MPKQPKAPPPRPDTWSKITVILLERHIALLDRLAVDIRLKHGKAISRAELIRGVIEAAERSGIDLTRADSAEAVVRVMLKRH